MANMTFGVNIIPKNNTVSLGTSQNKWNIYSNILNSLLIGTGTTGQDKGSEVSPRYIPTKWKYDYNIATPQNGDIITIKIPIAGHSYGDWISLDNGTTYYPIVTNGLSKLTTQYPVNSYITLIFEENGSASTIPIGGADSTSNITINGGVWRVINFYDSNTTNIVNLYTGNGNYLANSIIYRYQLLFQIDENTLTPLNNVSNSTATNKTMLTNVEFNPFGKIFYYNSTTTVNAQGSIPPSTQYYAISGLDIRYTLNCGTTLTAHKPLYLVVTPQNNGKVKLASSSPWAQTLPTSNDGKWYILLGRTYSTYQIALYSHHPVYKHDGTKVRNVLPDGYIIPTKVSELNNDSGFTTNVGTITGITMNGASKGTSGVVNLGTVITSHQDISGKAPLASPALTGTPTAPTAATTTENTQIATTAYVKNKIDSVLAANDAMIFKGTIGSSGATVTALPNTHNAGWTYKVITAATYAGKVCEIGDLIICITDGTAANNDHWTVVQTNIDGAVTGPTSSTNGHIATFNGTSGKVIKDSGYTIAKSVPSNAVFTDTDTKVTAVGNHYTPTEDTSAKLSVDASSSTAATWNSTSLVTGVDIKRDAKGHVVGIAVDSIKMPANSLQDRTLTIGSTGKTFNGTANVSWSLSEIGAVSKSGDIMEGNLTIEKKGLDSSIILKSSPSSGAPAEASLELGNFSGPDSSKKQGLYSYGYFPNNTSMQNDAKWLIYRDITGDVVVNGSAIDNVAKSGDTMTGDLNVTRQGNATITVSDTIRGHSIQLRSLNTGLQGLWTPGYYNGSSLVTNSEKWLIYRNTEGDVVVDNTPVKNILTKTGDTMTGNLTFERSVDTEITLKSKPGSASQNYASLQLGNWVNTGHQGLYSYGYYDNNGTYHNDQSWLVYRNGSDGKVYVENHYDKSEIDNKFTDRLSNFKLIKVQQTVTITAGSSGSPAQTTITINNMPSGKNIYEVVSMWLGGYRIPYITNSGAVHTWISGINGSTITFSNLANAWTNYDLSAVLLIY